MKLKKLEVTSFGGINPSSPVVIDFTQSKWVLADGDQETHKTTLLNAMLVACGQLSKDNKNFVNKDTNKIDINFEFVGNDRLTYQVRCTKSLFSLTYEGVTVAEPITKMKELLGVVGVSPMSVKTKSLSEIIKWLSSYSTKSAEEFEAQIKKIKDGIKSAKDGRAGSNKSLKGINEFLNNEPLFLDWEGSEKKYIKAIDVKELSQQLDLAGKDSDKLIRAEETLKNLKSDSLSLEKEIEQIKINLSLKEQDLSSVNKRIISGQKFVDENKSVKKLYETIKAKYDNAHTELGNYNKWIDIKKKKKEGDEFETLSASFDAKEKSLLIELKNFQAEILPDIKGIELITEDTHEDGIVKKEGLYLNGINAAQMSESEFWKLVMEIWRKFKVRIVVIDNYSSLGSKAVEVLEKLHKDGAYILAAEMNREQKSLEISYK